MFRFWKNWWWLILLLIGDVFFAIWWFGPRQSGVRHDRSAVPSPPPDRVMPAEPVVPPLSFGFPTAQTNLVDKEDHSVFMATASGRIESAHYGSTRTRSFGGRLLPAFHEGVDIGPLQRDSRNRALDQIRAVADGEVAYANRVIGHSNYGLYVVLKHPDPVGEIYSLYAHLRRVEDEIRPGTPVSRGDVIGVMGNTPSSIIPVVRSHLHFEIGMIRNAKFEDWAKEQGTRNLHGVFHGWNLTGIYPLAPYRSHAEERAFSMQEYLKTVPVAFEIVLSSDVILDYFDRYPSLWEGQGKPIGVMVLYVSEGGVILRGHSAGAEYASRSDLPFVLNAYPEVLGRNGLRLVVSRNEKWEIGRNGRKWLSIHLHQP